MDSLLSVPSTVFELEVVVHEELDIYHTVLPRESIEKTLRCA